jgi:hypothetical protein
MACLSTSHLYTTTMTDDSITVVWEPVEDVVNYQVEYQTNPGFGNPLGTWSALTGQTTNFATIIGLLPETSYLIRVNSVCETGNCYSVTIINSTIA